MSLDNILIIISSILAPILAVLVTYIIKKRGKKWKRVKSTRIPLWLIHSLYNKVFPSKTRLADGSHIFRGTYFEYKINFKSRIAEPESQIKHIIVYRKIRDDKI